MSRSGSAAPSELLVVKFGGSSLANGEGVARAAELVLASPARRKLVVVSAPGETTDQLISMVQGTSHPLDPWEVARLLSLGERLSARLLTTVLRSRGASAIALEPEDPGWPILTSGGPLGARADLEGTRARVEERLTPLLDCSIVVICGFLGIRDGRVTTLQRGGSDTTAVILGNFLGAREVVLVKDVKGVLNADPRIVPGAQPLSTLSAPELSTLADGGARVVSPEAVAHLGPEQRLRVLPFGLPLDSQHGTTVAPAPSATASPGAAPGRTGARESDRVGAVSAVVDDWQRGMEAMRNAVPPDAFYGLSFVPGAVTVFVREEALPSVVREMHASGAFRAVAERRGLSRLSIPLHGPSAQPLPARWEGTRSLMGAARSSGRLDLFVSPGEEAFFAPRREPAPRAEET